MFTNNFSEEIFNKTYSFNNETIEDTLNRVSSYIASVEDDSKYWSEQFYDLIDDFKFVPGGRIISNAGLNLDKTTMINCYVDGLDGYDRDSMESIMDALKRQALILRSEGGYGFNSDVLRPRGEYIAGIANESPGSVKMLDMWDTQSNVITSGSDIKTNNKNKKGKIRKGAQMVTQSCWHPDIEEFITAKQTKGKLTKFNMSVLITDEFIDAVQNNKEWNLIFPDFHKSKEIKEIYKSEWNGNIEQWLSNGHPVKIFKTYKNANELFDIILKSTFKRNEPGVLFVDKMNQFNNLNYCEFINATNPCGEQILPIGGICLLGSFNLTQFIDIKSNDFDYNKLKKYIPIANRFLDNVNDLTYVPLENQKQALQDKRRIGCGIMGYGSALAMLKIQYGSKQALELTEKLMSFISNEIYKSSSYLAKEKGSFKLYNEKEYLKSKFINNVLNEDTINLISKHGIRNSHLLSIQPTGNTGILANNVSGGLEPIFMPKYIRTSSVDNIVDGLNIPTNINWNIDEKFDDWNWIKEGDSILLTKTFNNIVYKIDKDRGLVKEDLIIDYGVNYNITNNSTYIPKTTTELNIDEHLDTLAIFTKYVDSATSKTINIPNDYSYDNFKNVYLNAYNKGTIKGLTTYRAGTMSEVLSSTNKNNSIINPKIERPKILNCDIHHVTAQGQKYYVVFGLDEKDNRPIEVFAFSKKDISIPQIKRTGKIIKIKTGEYNLQYNGTTIENISNHFNSLAEDSYTRSLSRELRYRIPIEEIVKDGERSYSNISSFYKAIIRTLKKNYMTDEQIIKSNGTICSECGGKLTIQEGCAICMQCGNSKCS